MTRPANHARNKQILDLYQQGFTSGYVAKPLGLSPGAVATLASRSGIRRCKWGINPERQRRQCAPEKHLAIVADRYLGLTYPELETKYGISAKACWRLVNERAL